MGVFLAILPILGQLLPVIIGLVHTAEVAFSGMPGQSGQAKKDLVTGVIAAAAQGANLDPAHASALTSAGSTMIDMVVKVLNAINIFKHGAAPAPLPPALAVTPPVAPPAA